MAVSLFASELRRAREARGWTREQFASEINYSVSQVEKVEREVNPPTRQFADAADGALKLDGLLGRIREDGLRQRAVPDWLRPWNDILDQATALRVFHPLVICGLLQVEPYARGQLQSTDREQTDSRVAARMERQRALFGREPALRVAVLLDESVLQRQVGDPATMREQLIALTEAPVSVQVLPTEAETPLGLDGPFELATVDGHDYAYAETPLRGFVLDGEVASRTRERWETLLAEALPARQSRERIREVAERWRD